MEIQKKTNLILTENETIQHYKCEACNFITKKN